MSDDVFFLPAGTLLNKGSYRIERVLGQGGFGITYLATDLNLDRQVAIKEFFPKDFCNRDETTSSVTVGTASNKALITRLKEKFLKEARHLAKLHHPNIVKIYAAFEENDTAYYAMDFVEGQSVSQLVKNNGPLRVAEALKFTEKVGSALEYLHSQRLNHLDVKPANIMVRYSNSEPVLIDFGLAKQYDSEGNQTSTTPVGISHGYAPIEQYNDGGVSEFSAQADLYSLAATFYFMVTGTVPPVAIEVFSDGLTFPTNFPQNFVDAVRKAMSPAKKQRHETVREFLNELKKANTFKADEATRLPSQDATFVPQPKKATVMPRATAVAADANKKPRNNKLKIILYIFVGLLCGLGSILYFTHSEMDQNTLKIKLPTQEKCSKIIDEAFRNLEDKFNDKQQEFSEKNHVQDIYSSGDTIKLKELEKEFLNTFGKDFFVTGSKLISASDISFFNTRDDNAYNDLSNTLRYLEIDMQQHGIEIPKIPDVRLHESTKFLNMNLRTQVECMNIIDGAIQNLQDKLSDKHQKFLDKNHVQDIMTSGDTTKLNELQKEIFNTFGKDYFVTGSKLIIASEMFCSDTKDSGFKYSLNNSLRSLEGAMQEYGIEIPKIPDVHIRETANPLKMNRQIQEECAKKIHESIKKFEKNLETRGIDLYYSLKYATDMTSYPSSLSRQQEIDKEYLSNEGKKNIVKAFKLIDVWQKFIPDIKIDDYYDFGNYQDQPFSRIPFLIALYRHYGIELPELSNIPESIMEEVRKIEKDAADGTLYESALHPAVAEVATD